MREEVLRAGSEESLRETSQLGPKREGGAVSGSAWGRLAHLTEHRAPHWPCVCHEKSRIQAKQSS